MFVIEERLGSRWKPYPHAYSLDVARHLAERAASGRHRRTYAVRVVELATGDTVDTYPAEATRPGEATG